MNPLQPLPPRRVLSPKTKARNGVSRTVFALPVIHQFEPVLGSSPKAYMVAKAARNADRETGDNVGSTPIVLSQPQRPKIKETGESPRSLRPQPPTGISARADVDIYRYSQGTEQRMAIRPLFEQWRASEEDVRLSSAKRPTRRSVKKRDSNGSVGHLDETSSIQQENRESVDRGDEKEGSEVVSQRIEETLNDEPVQSDLSNQEDGQLTWNEDEKAAEAVLFGKIETDAIEDAADMLMKPLTASTCHEPFIQTEGPKLSWLRNALENASPNRVNASNKLQNNRSPAKTNRAVYKVLAKGMRQFGPQSVLVAVVLSSRGDVHITCKLPGGDSNDSRIPISEIDLAQSRRIRPDLQIFTPTWADWVVSRVRCNGESMFSVDFEDDDGRRRCFSESMQICGDDVFVDMFVLTATDSLLVSVKNDGKTCDEILLSSDELRRLAVPLEKWPADNDETQDISELFHDHDFLVQLATKSNVIRLGRKCKTGFNDGLESVQASDDCCATSLDSASDVRVGEVSLAGLEFENSVRPLLDESKQVGTVALLAQAYVENCFLSALRNFQRQEAVQLNVAAYIQQAAATDSKDAFNARVEMNLKAAKALKLQEIAMASIVDDMIFDFIAYECRVELQESKVSGGYDDHYASKVQAAYRMSAQKRLYEHKRNVRVRAAQMLQALQRGIIARRRYSEMKVEREKYLFYGFRSSLYHTTANIKDPRLQSRELSKETERRRHAFLMQVLQGYVAENFVDDGFRIAAEQVRDVCSEYGIVVGCSSNFGDVVASYLYEAPDPSLYESIGEAQASTHSRLYSNSQVSAALLLGLREQYDDTFGLSSNARRLGTGAVLQSRRKMPQAGDSVPPRWMLKTCTAFQQSNRDRLAGLRLTRKAAGQKAAHLIARDYRNVLASSFNSFDSCRATWEDDIAARQEEQHQMDTFSIDELVQFCLDLLISCVKDWGLDPNPLFRAFNLCGRRCHGKTAVRVVEEKFNQYAARMNEVHVKQSVLTLREEISQELEDFEKLLALRCLNMALDSAVTVPTSELLHIMLKGNVDEEYIRHGLSVVLPIASTSEKHDLARKILQAYANASYGDAFNLICWSCLDVAENVTVEAARFLDKITRPTNESNGVDSNARNTTARSESLTARALYLLTGSQAVRFLQFLAKVAHFNKTIQKRVLAHLAPYAAKFEMHRLASAVCALDDFNVVSHLFNQRFSLPALRSCPPLWAQYKTLFGEDQTAAATCTTEP